VQRDVLAAEHLVLEVAHSSVHLRGGVVGINDHAAENEHQVLRVDDAQAVIAGLVEEEDLHSAIVGGHEERAQSDNGEAWRGGRGADADQSTFTPCPCSRAAVASSSVTGGTKMTAPSRPRVSSTR